MTKKLLIISENYWKYNIGGAELQCRYISEYFAKNNWEVHFIFLHDINVNSIDDNIHLHGIKKNRVLQKYVGKIIYFRKVLHIVKQINPQVIYHRVISSFAFPVLNYINNDKKMILHISSSNELLKKSFKFNFWYFKNKFENYCQKQIVKKSKTVVCQANYQKELLDKNWGIKDIEIIPNIHPVPKNSISKSEPYKIVWIANLKPLKQPEIFIQLADNFSKDEIKYIMIGKNHESEWSKDMLNEINKRENIEYLGEKSPEEVNSILERSHILINTSKYEGFPNTFIQAWMREVPVVSLNVDPDNVIKKQGLGYHSGTFEQMVEDIKLLISENAIRQEMAQNAYSFSTEKYSMKNLDKLINLAQ